MDFLELVSRRYSCRGYQPMAVEQAKLDYVMECVRLAPSAVNRQPWRFRIVSSDADRARLQQCYSREWFATAPVYVIASILHDEEWVRGDGKPLCLAAAAQGLGSCWVCNFDAELCKKLFSLADNEEAAVLIPLGYAADEPKEKKRKPMSDIMV